MGSTTRSTETEIAGVTTLREFLDTAKPLTLEERHLVIDQALVLIEQLYVHLPLKRAMHAIDPVQRLKLLRVRVGDLSERRFHDEMISIFVGLRDLHTNYILPAPFQSKTAFVPFRIEEFFEEGRRRYIVSAMIAGFSDEQFKPGVELTHWNGIPIDRAVDLNSDRQAGSNPDARHARGLEAMTIRPMGQSAPPDEEWVVVRYEGEGQQREITLAWQVFEPDPSPTGVDPNAPDEPLARALGYDALTEAVRRASKTLFAPEAMKAEREPVLAADLPGTAPAAGADMVSLFPDIFQFRTVTTPHGEFGYIRIRTFMGRDVDGFLGEVVRMAGLLPQNGLIVDVRGNGGGVIMAGERLIQLFTPRRVEPERLHFINTPLALRLCERVEDFEPWAESIAQAVQTGSTFSDGHPVLPGHAEDCNSIGQVYHGPVVLITDARCYSTTDICAAGWQDHAVGPIIGTDANTGAGGANVWTHDLVALFLGEEDTTIKPLPKDTSFRVAVRRSTRVGDRSGDPVEDLGVVPDMVHQMTRKDVLEGNPDLIARAGELLAGLPVRFLSAELQPGSDGKTRVLITTRNMSRVDVYVDGRPQMTLDVLDGETPIELTLREVPWPVLDLRGFEGSELVAARRIQGLVPVG
jgi:Peptidase family S41